MVSKNGKAQSSHLLKAITSSGGLANSNTELNFGKFLGFKDTLIKQKEDEMRLKSKIIDEEPEIINISLVWVLPLL
jgi:hypothetical protein